MKIKENGKELAIVLLASLILALAVSFLDPKILLISFISFVVIIGLNVFIKKAYAYYLEADIKIKFWEIYHYGFRKDAHFKRALPMLWAPLFFSLVTRGLFWFLPIIEFDVKPKTERVSKRHGLYRFSEMTDWHIGLIATSGILINLLFAIIGYISASWIPGLEIFAQLSIYYAAWSVVPLSSLDGSKILFGSKALWFTMLVIIAIFLGYSFSAI